MRTREEIQEEIAESNAENVGRDTVALLQLEVLLDIRDQSISESHWGIYCPQHEGSWLRKTDGVLIFYPSKEVTEAHLESILRDPLNMHLLQSHLWTVVEFGKQKYFEPIQSSRRYCDLSNQMSCSFHRYIVFTRRLLSSSSRLCRIFALSVSF